MKFTPTIRKMVIDRLVQAGRLNPDADPVWGSQSTDDATLMGMLLRLITDLMDETEKTDASNHH